MTPAASRTASPMERTQTRRPLAVMSCSSTSKGVPSRTQAPNAWVMAARNSGA